MRAKGVTQCVRMHVGGEAAQDRDALYDAGNTASGEPRLAARLAQAAKLEINQQGRRLETVDPGTGRQQCRALLEIIPQSHGGCISQRYVALLLAFAAHENRLVRPMNVFKIQPGQLCVAESA